MAVQEACELCHGTGWQQVDKDGVAGVARCECTKHSLIGGLLDGARIPSRFAGCHLEDFDVDPRHFTKSIRDAKFTAEKFVEEYPFTPSIGLLFVGRPGVGKTHLAVGIIKALIERRGTRCMFRAFPELLKEIQLSYNKVSNTSELALLEPVLDAEVLVLDELGAQKPSAWVLDTVSYVLNSRYNENRTTILTTNFPDDTGKSSPMRGIADSLIDRIGDRMRSRLYEMCKTVHMVGDDFRLQNKNKDGFLRAPDKNAHV